jgi:hypothetical protein
MRDRGGSFRLRPSRRQVDPPERAAPFSSQCATFARGGKRMCTLDIVLTSRVTRPVETTEA